MKLLLVALCAAMALVAGAQAAAVRDDDCALRGHIVDIAALIDQDALAAVLFKALDDPDVQIMLSYVWSPDFRALYLDVASQPEVHEFIHYLDDNCLNLRGLIDLIREYLGLPPAWSNRVAVASGPLRNGVATLFNELLAVLPVTEIHELVTYKYENYPEFKDFIDMLRSEETRQLYLQLAANPTYKYMGITLNSYGIDMRAVQQAFLNLMGWTLEP